MEKKSLNEFESEIFDETKNSTIKYSIDRDIEASVRYDFLQETYGKERVDEVLSDKGKNFLELCDSECYSMISENLSGTK
jgi:hypothetical protein